MENSVPDTKPGLPHELIPIAANVRTDLDHFSDTEIETIQYHGYTLLDYLMHKYGSDLPIEPEAPLSRIEYTNEKIEHVKADMSSSHKLRFRPFTF